MSIFSRRVLPVLLALAVSASVGLAQVPAPAKDPVVVGRFSLASIDALNKFLTDLGLPLNNSIDLKPGLESAPFLGAGTVASDKPVGVVVLAGDPHKLFPIQDSVFISVPVMPGKATAADLMAAGGKAVEGTTDTFSGVGGAMQLVRRTADYLHVKEAAGTWGLSTLTDALFTADYKDATNLFVASANMDAFRKAAPEAYKELAKQITSLPSSLGLVVLTDSKPVENALDKVDKLTIALAQDDVNFHLKSWLAPSPLSIKAKEAPRPAFPAGMIMRMHVVYPTVEAAGYIEKQLAALQEDAFGMGTPAALHKRVKDLVVKAATLNTRTEAVSVAFAMKEGKPVFYLVDQFSADFDALKEIADIAKEGVSLATEGGSAKLTLDSSTYTVGDKKAQRLTLSPGGAQAAEKVVIDEIQSGRTLYVAISLNSDAKYVVDLANAGLDGKSSVLCAGAVDLGAVAAAAIDAGGMPGLTPDMLQKLKVGWAGQGVTWTVQSSEQNFLYTDVQVSKQVIRDLVKMTTFQVQPVPAGTEQPAMP